MTEGRIKGVKSKVYNGIAYRSTLEADTAETLDKLGIPFEYEKRRITLLDSFQCPYQKKKVVHITYTPDFELSPFIILECKGFETPEWRLKKKYVFKYLMEREPYAYFYQIKDARGQLLQALDTHWIRMGYAVKVTSKPSKKNPSVSQIFDSIEDAFNKLNLKGKPIGALMRSFTGKTEFVYGYNWKLKKLKL